VGLNIAALKKRTRGILDVVPKHRDGTPIADLAEAIVRRPDGTSVKQYEGFLDYLASFPPDAAGVPVIPERYRNPQGRIVDACFVATVAYGSPLAPQVDTFRRFRDDVLAQTPGGGRLVELYYRHGSSLAGAVAERPWLRASARVLLLPAAGAAHLLLATSQEIRRNASLRPSPGFLLSQALWKKGVPAGGLGRCLIQSGQPFSWIST